MKKKGRSSKRVRSLHQPFSKKIKSVRQLIKIIGTKPREKTVVMCHGVFDIVHPGHIRHLAYAKTKGNILVASLPVDKHVAGGKSIPYVPQELRALNLAALEVVDYVVIDKNPTVIQNIKFLKPDIFVKGADTAHSDYKFAKKILAALKSYGGKLMHSPGDIIYSSTQLLKRSTKPKLLVREKLITVMDGENLTFDMLKKTIKNFQGINIHVIGDLIVDKISRCTILGPSKDLAFSVRLDQINSYVGAAGIVAKHLQSLGANVTLTTLVGKDEAGEFAIKDLEVSRVKTNFITENDRATTIKERFVTPTNQVLLQVNKLENTIITDETLRTIRKLIRQIPADAVVLSDFRHGIFNKETVKKITNSIKQNVLKVADSQVSNRWGNILDFRKFDLITPNEKEARFALGDQDTSIRPLSQHLYNTAKCKFLILKLGEEGILTYRSPGWEAREFFYLDSFADEIIDPIGAGDALLSAATLGLAASKNIVQASILGNLCAALECSKLGNVPIFSKELMGTINQLDKYYNKSYYR